MLGSGKDKKILFSDNKRNSTVQTTETCCSEDQGVDTRWVVYETFIKVYKGFLLSVFCVLITALRAVSSTLGDTRWVVYETFIMVYKLFFLSDFSAAVIPALRAVSSSSTLGDTRWVVYETFINVINVFFVQTSLLSQSPRR